MGRVYGRAVIQFQELPVFFRWLVDYSEDGWCLLSPGTQPGLSAANPPEGYAAYVRSTQALQTVRFEALDNWPKILRKEDSQCVSS